MIKKFLKIAGVKNEQEFYKKYPTEAAFFKAHPNAKDLKKHKKGGELKKLDQLTRFQDGGESEIGSYMETLTPDVQPMQFGEYMDYYDKMITGSTQAERDEAAMMQAQSSSPGSSGGGVGDMISQILPMVAGMKHGGGIPKAQGGGYMWGSPSITGAPPPMAVPQTNLPQLNSTYAGTAAQQAAGSAGASPIKFVPNAGGTDILGNLGGAAGIAGIATDLIGGIEAIGAQKKAMKEAKKQMKVAGVVEQAAGTRPEPVKRRYVRPEDVVIQPDQLFPTYGVGTNYLAKEGTMIGGNPTEIQNMYNPGDIYSGLAYEPLDNSNVKQFRHGGMPKAQGGFDFGAFATGGGSQMANALGSKIGGGSGWGQVGGAVLGGVGTAIGGPVGGMIGKFVGQSLGALDPTLRKMKNYQEKTQKSLENAGMLSATQGLQSQYSGYMEDGGWVSHDWQPQVIAKFGEYDVKDLLKADPTMDTLRAGGNIRQNYMFPQDKFALGGELQTHWGGDAESMSYNPYLPDGGETIMFRGQSHNESDGKGRTGIGVTYGENPVEVERGEPALKLKDGSSGDSNLVVYGDLKISKMSADEIGDPNAKGRKFKHYVADLSKQENKQNKLVDKTIDLVDNTDDTTPFGKLTMGSAIANMMGASMKLKGIADKKTNAAAVQNAINETSEEMGLKASDLAVGKITKEKKNSTTAQTGSIVPYAPDNYSSGLSSLLGWGAPNTVNPQAASQSTTSATTGSDEPKVRKVSSGKSASAANIKMPDPSQYTTDRDYMEALYASAEKQKRGNIVAKFQEEFHKRYPEFAIDISRKDPRGVTSAGKKNKLTKKELTEGTDVNNILKKNNEDGIFGERTVQYKKFLDDSKSTPQTTPTSTTPVQTTPTQTTTASKSDIIPAQEQNKKFDWGMLAGQLMPFLRPTDAEALDYGQLSKEMLALATNQLEPVQAQLFTPELATPYDISLQDQLNEITANQRSAERLAQGDPSALSAIAAQSNMAKSKVLGEQFRLNQAQKASVYNDNRQALMDARKINLGILDQQYARQSEARSKTKTTALEAVGSIADKIAKNKLENRTLQVYENMYNYRYDPKFRAINWNAPYMANIPQISDKTLAPVYDKDGKFMGYKMPSEETATTTSEETTAKGKFGKSVSKKSKLNSSIVKAFKNI